VEKMVDFEEIAFEIAEDICLRGRYMKNGYPTGDEVMVPAGRYIAVHLLPPVCLLIQYNGGVDNLCAKHAWVVFIQHLYKEMFSHGIKVEIQA